ncbi:MAG: BON domain-containing protein [Rhizomicrobium sp.]
MSLDSQLQLSVLAELEWEPSVTAAHIGVTANVGVVTLTGHVESYAQKHAAEAGARRVKGVLAVADDLKVQLPFERKRGDDDIAGAVLERLAWDVSVPSDAVQVRVERGWVTLTGEVGWHYQREAAEQDVRRLHGVVGVSNQVSLKPRLNVTNISNDISCALHRSYFPDPEAISVTAEGGRVRLTGNVHSWHARQVAAETAWGAPGVVDVENLLAVI